jgi:hypothetical protein
VIAERDSLRVRKHPAGVWLQPPWSVCEGSGHSRLCSFAQLGCQVLPQAAALAVTPDNVVLSQRLAQQSDCP